MNQTKQMWESVGTAVGVTIATTIVMRFVFDPARAGTPAMLIALGLLYAICTAVAVLRLARRGELRAIFRPSFGDLTLGVLTAGLLWGAAHLVEAVLTPHGSAREAWVMRLYLQ